METVNTSGAAFVEFWSKAAGRGEMNQNTAGSLRAAAKSVLEIEDGWEQLDVRSIDVESLLRRFANKKGGDFKTESLRQYQRRFRQAYDSFLQYAADPAAWKPPVQGGNGTARRETKRDRPSRPASVVEDDGASPAPAAPGASGVEYPFPLRGGTFMAKLRLPTDLAPDEADRLHLFIKAVANATSTKAEGAGARG